MTVAGHPSVGSMPAKICTGARTACVYVQACYVYSCQRCAQVRKRYAYLEHLLKVRWQHAALRRDQLPQQRTHGNVQALVAHGAVCVVEQQRVSREVVVQHVLLHADGIVGAAEAAGKAAMQHLHAERVAQADGKREFVEEGVENDAGKRDRRNGLERTEHADFEV